MAAKDYILAVSSLTNSVMICKRYKKGKETISEDKAYIDQNLFIDIVMQWAGRLIEDDKFPLEIKVGDKVVVTIDKKALGLAADAVKKQE